MQLRAGLRPALTLGNRPAIALTRYGRPISRVGAGQRPAPVALRPAPCASANALAQWAGLIQVKGLPDGQAL